MTGDGLRALIKKCKEDGSKLIGLYLDNETSEYFFKDRKGNNNFELTEDNIVTIGGEEMLAIPNLLTDNKMRKRTIGVTTYIILDRVQSIMVLNDLKDESNIDRRDLYID